MFIVSSSFLPYQSTWEFWEFRKTMGLCFDRIKILQTPILYPDPLYFLCPFLAGCSKMWNLEFVFESIYTHSTDKSFGFIMLLYGKIPIWHKLYVELYNVTATNLQQEFSVMCAQGSKTLLWPKAIVHMDVCSDAVCHDQSWVADTQLTTQVAHRNGLFRLP